MKKFWNDMKAEWKKISWPTKKILTRKTGIVAVSSVVLGAAIVLMDYLSQNIVNLVVGLF